MEQLYYLAKNSVQATRSGLCLTEKWLNHCVQTDVVSGNGGSCRLLLRSCRALLQSIWNLDFWQCSHYKSFANLRLFKYGKCTEWMVTFFVSLKLFIFLALAITLDCQMSVAIYYIGNTSLLISLIHTSLMLCSGGRSYPSSAGTHEEYDENEEM